MQRHGGLSMASLSKQSITRLATNLLLISWVFLGSAPESQGSTGRSWLQQPSWAGTDQITDRRPALSRNRYTASPFTPGSNNLALDVGQIFLMGDLGEYSDSIGSQIHYTYGVSDLFGFDSSLGYSDHSDGKFSMITLLAGLRTNLSWYDKVVPYLVFGLGFYRPSYQQLVSASASATGNATATSVAPVLFGVHLGPGVDLEVTRNLFFGTSLTFHDVFGSTRYTADGKLLNVGGTYTSFFLHAGVTF